MRRARSSWKLFTGLGVGLLAAGSLGLRVRESVEKRWGKSELTLRIEQRRDAGYTITRCFFCQRRIIHRGSAAEGRAAADLHRETRHPDVVRQKRRHLRAIRVGTLA